jgi:predicted metalloprotease with PDZ domain
MLVLAALATLAALPVTGSALHAQQATPPLLIPGKQFGFAFEPDADGVKIVFVVENSPAARAGLKVGMLVTRLNGIPLGALDMVRLRELFVAAPDDVTLVVTPLGWVKLHREAVPSQ